MQFILHLIENKPALVEDLCRALNPVLYCASIQSKH